MIHVYKAGGAWSFEGFDYTVKAIEPNDFAELKKDGWVKSLEELLPKKRKAKLKPKAKED